MSQNESGMRFWHHAGIDNADIFPELDDDMLRLMEIDAPSKRVPFNPVRTSPGSPLRIMFVGLNAAADDSDFAEAHQQRNFTEWCQDNYNTKFCRVIDKYRFGLHRDYLGDGSLYFTDFVKVVLRESSFGREHRIVSLLNTNRQLRQVFRRRLQPEVEGAASEGCRIWICFGNNATRYFDETVADVQAMRSGSTQRHADGARLAIFTRVGHNCLRVWEKHYAFCDWRLTNDLVTQTNAWLCGDS